MMGKVFISNAKFGFTIVDCVGQTAIITNKGVTPFPLESRLESRIK